MSIEALVPARAELGADGTPWSASFSDVYHAGGGVKHWLVLRDRGFMRGVGVRVDGRLYVLVKGIELRDRPRPHGAISGLLFVTF